MAKKEPIISYLRRRLAGAIGMHSTIAQESGVPQSTVNRIYLGRVSPRLDSAQPLLDWFEAQDLKAAKLNGSARRPKAGHGVLVNRRATRATAAPLR
jgi:predicted transcriptional regulator